MSDLVPHKQQYIGRSATGLADALRALAQEQEDHIVAEYLDQVVARVEQYSNEPTRDQMQGALWNAEISVVHRIAQSETTILEAIHGVASTTGELREGIALLQAGFQSLAERVSDNEHRITQAVQRNAELATRLDELTIELREALRIATDERAIMSAELTAIKTQLGGLNPMSPEERERLLIEHQEHGRLIAELRKRLGMTNGH